MFTIVERSVVMSRRVALFVGAAAVVVASLLLQPGPAVAAATEVITLPGCPSHCGNISIPYPFGVNKPGCHLPGLNVTCRNDSSLFLGDGTVEVLEISIPNATVRINASVTYFPGSYGTYGNKPITSDTWRRGALGVGKGGVYTLALKRNMMLVIGCNVQVFLMGYLNRPVSTCNGGLCDWDEGNQTRSYLVPGSGVSYCVATISNANIFYDFSPPLWFNTNGEVARATSPRMDVVVWISEQDVYTDYDNKDSMLSTSLRLPAVLDWRVLNHSTCHRNGSSASCRSEHSSCHNAAASPDTYIPDAHICVCHDGYKGNPYIPNGCRDVNECDDPKTYPCYGVCTNTQGGHHCKCQQGFVGNASIPNGCQDIDECAHPDRYSCYGDCINKKGTFQCLCKHGTYGDPNTKGGCSSLSVLKIGLIVGSATVFLLLESGAPFITRKIKMHKVKKRKESFFKQNHGLLLQQLESQRSDIGGRMIVTLGELEKATNNFDPSHKVGGGGHGIVYKGILDLQVVAIKKSKIIVQKEIDDFINEVAILSQINHRNIVKLLGCCLETEVPLLVYEFISNGTLAHHLHVEGNVSLPWDDRMRIALESSKAVAYLHSAASIQILHRDIKSSNILLDDNLTAKVSDFGASRYTSIDQTGVTTAIQGTFGYLDPMYCYTSRLTDKSDVFSFGVLLIELLTRKRPNVLTSDGDSLVSHFASLIAEGDLFGIIDPQIMEEAEGEKVEEVAKLAAMCTELKGEDRPTMREVEMTLESLLAKKRQVQYNGTPMPNGGDETTTHYMAIGRDHSEASRQYTMEEEILLSATYPR